jgi:hypothetical protein
MVTRAENIISRIDEVAYLVAHGEAMRSTFKVPSNVNIAFFSKPGYLLMDTIYFSGKFQELLRSKNKSLAFIKGNKAVFPETLIERNWNWKDYVYETGTDCPDLNIEIYDHNPLKTHLNEATGLYVPGYNGKFLHGERGKLSDVAKYISDMSVNKSKQWMLFVNACRVLPGLTTTGLTTGELIMQTYGINPGNFPLNLLRKHEASTSRIIQRKRIRKTPPSSPDYMTGSRITKRPRVIINPTTKGRSKFKSSRVSPKTRILKSTASGIRKK